MLSYLLPNTKEMIREVVISIPQTLLFKTNVVPLTYCQTCTAIELIILPMYYS